MHGVKDRVLMLTLSQQWQAPLYINLCLMKDVIKATQQKKSYQVFQFLYKLTLLYTGSEFSNLLLKRFVNKLIFFFLFLSVQKHCCLSIDILKIWLQQSQLTCMPPSCTNRRPRCKSLGRIFQSTLYVHAMIRVCTPTVSVD